MTEKADIYVSRVAIVMNIIHVRVPKAEETIRDSRRISWPDPNQRGDFER